MPLDVALELPGDREAVLRDAAVVEGRHLGREDRHQVAVGIERRQRLVEEPRAVVVLHADREVAVQDAHRLPPERLELSAAATPGGREPGLGLGARLARDTRHVQHSGLPAGPSGPLRPSAG
jgi:hypothetical protein